MNLRSLQYRTSWIRVYSSCLLPFFHKFFLSSFYCSLFFSLFHRCSSIWPRMRMENVYAIFVLIWNEIMWFSDGWIAAVYNFIDHIPEPEVILIGWTRIWRWERDAFICMVYGRNRTKACARALTQTTTATLTWTWTNEHIFLYTWW